jgi:colanic acid biosynthesis glycosyl transferase WcaI
MGIGDKSLDAGDTTPRRKILIHGINFPPEPIGTGRYTGELAAYLAAQGESVEVVTALPHYPGWRIHAPYKNGRYTTETLNGIKVIRCPLWLNASGRGIWRLLAPLTFGLAAAPVVFWRIIRTRPHTVVCVKPTLLSAPAAVLAAKIVGARRVLHVQDLEIDAAFNVGHLQGSWLRKAAKAFERFMLLRFDVIITISERMAQKLAINGALPEDIKVIRNWVNTSKIKYVGGPNGFRKQLGISDGAFVVLYSGQIGPKQALGILLEAALECKENPNIQFVVAGDGPSKQQLVDNYSHLQNVHFLPIQPEDRLCELLNLADLHVLTQARNTADLVLPSKLGGMLASGRSVLVTADLGTELADLLDGAAILVPPGDTRALAIAIAKASLQDRIPSSKLTKLKELFSSETILPVFRHEICGHAFDLPAVTEDPAVQAA